MTELDSGLSDADTPQGGLVGGKARLLEDPRFHLDPYSVYGDVFASEPVVQCEMGYWAVGGYEEVRMCQGNPGLSSDFTKWSGYDSFAETFWSGKDSPIAALQRSVFVFMDGEKHSRLRRLVSKVFSIRAVEQLRPLVDEVVSQLLGDRDLREPIDVVTDLALPLSTTVISTLLGIPEADRAACRDRAVLIGRAFGPPPLPEMLPKVEAAIGEANSYFGALLEDRRANPGTDLISILAQVEEGGDCLSSSEIIATVNLLFGAGHETTAAMIGNAVNALEAHPNQLKHLRDRTVEAEAATEEFLRFDTPFQLMRKVTTKPTEIAGVIVPEDSVLLLFNGAGNRDKSVFDRPHDLDLTRTNIRPLSFGYGPHHCLGAALARQEVTACVKALAAQAKSIEFAGAGPVRLSPEVPVRGFEKLPVHLS